MAKVKSPHEKVGNTSTKKKKKNKNKYNVQASQKNYCDLCRKSYSKKDIQVHMHGMQHHRELQTVLGKDSCHECQACKESSMGLNEYAQHITTDQHKAKLNSLVSRNIKPPSLNETLGKKIMNQVRERNKTLKLRARREMKKKKKKQKQMAGQKRVEILQQAAERNRVVSTVVTLENSKQVNQRFQEQMQDIYKEGTKNAVVQNKENNVSCRGPEGQTWHNPYVWDKSTHQLKSDNFSGSSYFSKVKFDVSRINRYFRKPHNAQRSVVNVPDQTAWRAISRHDCYRKQHGVTDFTSDALPQNGAIVFDHSPKENTAPSQPVQESSHSLEPPASANSSANAAPMQDIDVSAMLRHIRRELGVREPCRADREARRQNSEVGVRSADQAGVKRAEEAGCSFRNYTKEAGLHITAAAATSVQSSAVSLLAPASSSCVRPSNTVSTQPKQLKKIQRTSPHCEKSSVVASDTNGPSNGKERESQGGLDSFHKTPPNEPNVNFIRKVRIAHKPGKGQEGKEVGLKPALNKMLSTAAARSRLSCREMYGDVMGKKQVRAKGTPRFGIELAKPPSDQDHSAQEEDLPLSEGFHWESLPRSPPDAQRNGLPPQPWGATYKDSHMETQSDPQKQESLEPPGAAQEACGEQMVKAISVKVEPSVADGNRDLKDGSGARKRKHKMDTVSKHGDTSDKDPKGKRMKTKSNKDQDQMDQLLAVSLREEELSQSLQDLDKSLIQARNTLQVAYAEVQRLLLWRQQCMTEVNSLRAQRIEILQGIQGGQSGEHRAERATTSSAGVAAVMQSRLSPLSSSNVLPSTSNQKLPDSQPVPSTSQPLALSTVPLKQEICEAPILLCNPETPQVPVNLPVHLLPSDLFQPLLLTSCSAATTTSADSLKQLETACSTTVNVSPESSAQQQEQVSWEGLKDCGKAVRLIREDADSESEGENIQPAAEKPISTAADNNGGSKSDDSVKMVEPSNLIVIDLDESDIEEIVSNVPNQEPPQKSVSVELKTANTQTCQQNDDDRKPILVPAMDAVSPPDCADVVEDDEPSLGAFENHQGPVLGLQIHKGLLYTCSGDNTARAYSLMSRECQAVFKGHTNKVNCLLVSPPSNMPERLFTGSSDQTIRCYSIKSQKCLEQISLSDRVLCLHIAWNILFAGLASGSVVSHDLKTLKQLDVFECHGPRGVSCLGTTQEGACRVLLVGSYDSTISVRDAKNGLLLRSLEGHTKTVLCMKVVNDLVFSGSSDKSVHAHNIHTGELLRIYKGHGHAVTSMVILGKVMVTACLDKLVRVYELQSHDRLQVYGGHSDMVMCMTVHKSVMYTGCYDGSVQAVKLNLMENYRCWWQNCSLIFGMGEHLVQHLIKDHTNRNLMTAKCRWRGCSAFFAKQESVREELPEHMQTHVENDSKVQP